jgi:hypothetical protein
LETSTRTGSFFSGKRTSRIAVASLNSHHRGSCLRASNTYLRWSSLPKCDGAGSTSGIVATIGTLATHPFLVFPVLMVINGFVDESPYVSDRLLSPLKEGPG